MAATMPRSDSKAPRFQGHLRRLAHSTRTGVVRSLGGPERARVILVLAAVGGLASADVATVGASATQLRQSLHISNTDIGLLVALSSVVGAVASIPFGVLADRVSRKNELALSIVLWGVAMVWSATASSFGRLLLARLALGVVTASAGPAVASLVGDYFAAEERGRIYSFISAGELAGAGIGFAVTGDIAALSWRAAFVVLALPAFVIALMVFRLREPVRGGTSRLLPGGPSTATSRAVLGELRRADSKITDAQRLAAERGISVDVSIAESAPADLRLVAATRYVLRVRTNVLLIVSGACAYYFLAGVQTFGVEFVKGQYHINQAWANLLMIIVGGGAGIGVVLGGPLGDHLLRRGHLSGRVLVAAVAATVTTVLFIPVLATTSAMTALPYVVGAAAALSAQNPPIDAARLDIMPAALWGRAEGVRTLFRTGAQAMAPLLFGGMSDLLGGGPAGLRWTFVVMLLPLGASAFFLFRALGTYPKDVATAAAASARMPQNPP